MKSKVWNLFFSGCAFLGQEPNPVQKVEEEGLAFHTENQMPRGMLLIAFVTMLTNMIVDCGTRLNKQAQDLSLQTHNNQVHREAGDSHV